MKENSLEEGVAIIHIEKKGKIITIPYKKPVKEFYVKKVVELLHLEVLYEKEC